MAKCASCGSTVVFGGARDGEIRYCNGICRKSGPLTLAKATVPAELLEAWVAEVHGGPCPVCALPGRGTVDVHESFRVWSLGWTFWSTASQLSCCRCGQRARVSDLLFSLFLGPWGLPFGPLVVPLQVGRNLIGLLSPPRQDRPSLKLHELGRLTLARQRLGTLDAGSLSLAAAAEQENLHAS